MFPSHAPNAISRSKRPECIVRIVHYPSKIAKLRTYLASNVINRLVIGKCVQDYAALFAAQ